MNSQKKLAEPAQYLKGVGPAKKKLLSKIGVYSVLDFLFYPPYDYEDRTKILNISNIREGEKATFILKIGRISEHRTKNGRKILSAVAYDEYGSITLTWFFFSKYLHNLLKPGKIYFVYGAVEFYRGEFQITHPELIPYEEGIKNKDKILPVYHLTEGITQNYLRKEIKKLFEQYGEYIEEYYPDEFLEKYALVDIKTAVKNLHFPDSLEIVPLVKKRFAFDEFFSFNYIMEKRKKKRSNIIKKPYVIKYEIEKKFLDSIPFLLTNAQKRVISEIKTDFCSKKMMYRLVQGDVGSGKTIVAAYALYVATKNGYQAVFMAPTSILAKQHYEKIKTYLKPLDIKMKLLIGSTKEKEKKEIIEEAMEGKIDIIIGTHALFYERVKFKKLDLVIIDEQHKFGVEQRKALQNKGENPHYLIMTATPIPRTTALVFFGDTDISVIDELPGGRKPIKTVIRYEKDLPRIFSFIKEEIKKEHQIYVVYPLIEENEKLDLKSAEKMFTEYQKIFGKENVGLLHGKMSDEEKETIMTNFKENKIKILVSTTVIEVGVDSPNATVLIIEHPERFGLAQLHQLRGRVGRNSLQSYAILLISKKLSPETMARLKEFAKTTDGFKIAELDLKYRGSGELLGKQQHGIFNFKFSTLSENKELFLKTKKIVKKVSNQTKCDEIALLYFPFYQDSE